jgi:hypothetical protein
MEKAQPSRAGVGAEKRLRSSPESALRIANRRNRRGTRRATFRGCRALITPRIPPNSVEEKLRLLVVPLCS